MITGGLWLISPAILCSRQSLVVGCCYGGNRRDVLAAGCDTTYEPSAVFEQSVGPGGTAVLDAARLAVSLRRTRAVHLEHLRETVRLPLLYMPYLFVRAHGLRVTRMIADALGQELGL